MTTTTTVLLQGKTLEASQVTQYTSTGVTTIIDRFTVANYSGASVTVSVNLVTSGDSAASGNVVTYQKVIVAGQTYTFPELTGHNLASGDSISTLCSAASSASIRISGRVIT